ncbi:hypothetical protein AWJ20_3801 [Sugiyamaella lignohabitans]|uniref:Domain of unknown function at the cortex 1 domain-containing protein n=1 Tax=Sugiyamaella lignohabitans TaxID=796027 RepID=A0A161HGN4_9ASCO|nr:uncharacterized protein AWJ20_3801 [Sugiyamaella lignohabitans]ANB11007.1 hypothetical protein AWJ20_3801 [Sugiyamaella lignohabitans]
MAPHLLVYAGTSYDKDQLVKVPVNKGDDASYIELDCPHAVDGVVRLAIRIKNFKDVRSSKHDPPEQEEIEEAVVVEEGSETDPKASVKDMSRSSSTSSNASNSSRTSTSSRLKNYLKKKKSRSPSPSPADSPYFEQENHKQDQLSIQFSIRFADPVAGDNLLFGNDFDEPIRDILPYGFSLGYKMFQWYIDPSVEGDPMADKPYLYGRALTSINAIHENDSPDIKWDGYVNGDKFLNPGSAPEKVKQMSSSERMTYFRDKSHRQSFDFVANNLYTFDFFTPYLTLGDSFGVQLPGFKFDVGKYCGGQPLRYVLKNLLDDSIYLVVVFSLVNE